MDKIDDQEGFRLTWEGTTQIGLFYARDNTMMATEWFPNSQFWHVYELKPGYLRQKMDGEFEYL